MDDNETVEVEVSDNDSNFECDLHNNMHKTRLFCGEIVKRDLVKVAI